jgi:hypothetical protein
MDSAYVIDPADRVVAVDDGWIAFANENDAPDLPERVIGVSLWTFVANDTVRELYSTLFRRIRATGRDITISFRGDSPSTRRYMKLSVGRGNGPPGTLLCRATLLRMERQSVPFHVVTPSLWSTAPPPWEESCDVVMSGCSWCRRVNANGWREIDDALLHLPTLFGEPVGLRTTGVCPACARMMLEHVRQRPAAGDLTPAT